MEGNQLYNAGEEFLDAYSHLEAAKRVKVASDFLVNLVMHVHQKKSLTRKTYPSILHIAQDMYDDCKQMDERLPRWPKLAPLDKTKPMGNIKLRELRDDGLIPDSELVARGYVLECMVVPKDKDIKPAEHIHFVHAHDPSLKTVTLKRVETDADNEESTKFFAVDRKVLMSKWVPYKPPQLKQYSWGEYPDPSEPSSPTALGRAARGTF